MPLSALLAAVDFSAGSRDAVRIAALIARRHGAIVTLLHVDCIPDVAERMAIRAPADVWESYLRDRAESAHRLLEQLAMTLTDVHTRIAIAQGDVPRAIVAGAVHDRSGLVVLGAHGMGTSRRSWLGSVPFEVAAHTRCPALIARGRRAPSDDGGFRRPLIAMGLDGAIDAAIGLAASLCAEDAVLHFVHVSESPSTYGEPIIPLFAADARRQALAQRASWLKAEASRLWPGPIAVHFDEAESASESILDRIEREEHDLVIVNRRATSTPSGSLGAATRRLLEYADVSVAVIPPPQ
jgi:nucleotide-binding universal stress UspA family protein